jgi:hypothetical protein
VGAPSLVSDTYRDVLVGVDSSVWDCVVLRCHLVGGAS